MRRVINCTIVPKKNAMATDKNMPSITDKAFSVFIKSSRRSGRSSPCIFSIATAKDAPSKAKTIDTVVEVGIPKELKISRSIISATITAMKIQITSKNEKCSGLNMPWRAISIIPLLITAPMKTPIAAMVRIVLNDAALAPSAEFRKFTASLLTPTNKSKIASTNKQTIIATKMKSIIFRYK